MYNEKDAVTFLHESNLIEDIDDGDADNDALCAFQLCMSFPVLTPFNIRSVHQMLTRWQLGYDAGKFRSCDVWIGGRMGANPCVVPGLVEEWCDDIAKLENTPTPGMIDWFDGTRERLAKRFHVRFERIHPFVDGNGRVGRILWQWHRLRMGLPLKIIYAKQRAIYYAWFRTSK